MLRRRDQTIQMLQEKQRQKRQQQQEERDRNTIDLTTEPDHNLHQIISAQFQTPQTNTLSTGSLATRNARDMHAGSLAEQSVNDGMDTPVPLSVLEPFLQGVIIHLRSLNKDGSFSLEVIDLFFYFYCVVISFN